MSGLTRKHEVRLIRVRCPRLTCRRVLAVPEDTRGRIVRCRACGMAVKVPTAAPAEAPGQSDR